MIVERHETQSSIMQYRVFSLIQNTNHKALVIEHFDTIITLLFSLEILYNIYIYIYIYICIYARILLNNPNWSLKHTLKQTE